MVARVVVLPLPVGPVTTIKPCGSASSWRMSFLILGEQAEFGEIEQTAIARQQADDGRFAMLGRHGGDANIDLRARHLQPCRAVLRQAPFGDVETCQNLDPGDQGLRQGIGRRRHGAEQTIDPHAHHEAVAERFDMDIAGAQLHRFFEHVIDRAHDRGAAREIAQTFNVVIGARARRGALPRPPSPRRQAARRERSRYPRRTRPRPPQVPPRTISAAWTAAVSLGSATASR